MERRERTTRRTFPKGRRLREPAQFARVKADGRTERGVLLVLGVLTDLAPENGLRAGLVTSKRIGGAVIRNRVRRRLREIVRMEQHRLRKPLWLVMIARPAAARATSAQLRDEWLRLANRASILAP